MTKAEWKVDLAGESFAVIVRPTGRGRVVYEIERLITKREPVGEIHEEADGTLSTAAFEGACAKQALESLIPVLRKKFHSPTTSLRKAGR